MPFLFTPRNNVTARPRTANIGTNRNITSPSTVKANCETSERPKSSTLVYTDNTDSWNSSLNLTQNSLIQRSTMNGISKKYPLRSMLLDPDVCQVSRSRTRSELMKKLKSSFIPHPSFDLNDDGYVSQEDYRNAKRFDIDCDGMLNPYEQNLARQTLAKEFFANKSSEDLARIDLNYAQNSFRTNVNTLSSSIR
jgi:hypothetical protein